MKIILGVVTGALVLMGSQAAETSSAGQAGVENSGQATADAGGIATAALGRGPAVRVTARGWEIHSASAIKRNTVTRSLPDYRQRKRVGEIKSEVRPRKGEFLVVLVQSRWATTQAPNETLWSGKPEVALVDDQGTEHKPLDVLQWQAGEYVTRGMGRRNTRQAVPRNSQALIYFDVPSTTGRTFSLRFSKDGALLPVNRVLDLPQLDLSKLD